MFNRNFLISIFIISSSAVSARTSLPANYESLSGCDKQELLWKKIKNTKYSQNPELKNLGPKQLFKMSRQELTKKTIELTDEAPEGWIKYLHAHGSMAKVKIIVPENFEKSSYTGIFQGAECALIRLSVTYSPHKKGKAFAPGLALKVLRDDIPSANISALYTLNGQGENYNFFENALSNIVPMGSMFEFGLKLVHFIFSKVAAYPEQLKTLDMATFNSKGNKENTIKAPKQIFFVPHPGNNFTTKEHDFRNNLQLIKKGTILYDVHAYEPEENNFNYDDYTLEMIPNFLKKSKPIARIISDSDFISSSYGDDRILFRHEVDPKNKYKK